MRAAFFDEAAMTVCTSSIAIAVAMLAAAAIAQPGKDDRQAKVPPTATAAPVVLASAENVRQPASAEIQRPADRPRRSAPRVTTCRCGDPQPDSGQPDQ